MSDMHVRIEDNSKLEKLVESSKLTRDQEFKDPTTAGRALRDYVMYGKKSPFLRRSTLKEVQGMTSDFLIDQAKEAMQHEVDIFYTGTINEVAVIDQIKNRLSISENLKASKSPITMDYKKHKRNKVFLIDDPNRKSLFVDSIGKAFQEIGFCAVRGHFLDDELVKNLYAQIKLFFDPTLRFVPAKSETQNILPFLFQGVPFGSSL